MREQTHQRQHLVKYLQAPYYISAYAAHDHSIDIDFLKYRQYREPMVDDLDREVGLYESKLCSKSALRSNDRSYRFEFGLFKRWGRGG